MTDEQTKYDRIKEVIDSLASEVHDSASARRLYAREPSTDDMIVRVIRECFEAWDAVSNDNFIASDLHRLNRHDNLIQSYLSGNNGKKECAGYEAIAKNSFEDELADVFIMVLSISRHMGIDIWKYVYGKMKYNSVRKDKEMKL